MSYTREQLEAAASQVTFGSDPEFCFLTKGTYPQVISANTVIDDPYRRKPVGCDGASSTGELRPAPGATTVKHLSHLRDLIGQLAAVAAENDLVVDTVGDHRALGCHVHVGFPAAIRDDDEFECLVRRLTVVLDHFVGKRLLVFSGRARASYRRLGTWRLQPHGFEYRPLPALIINHPVFAAAVFDLIEKLVRKALPMTTLETTSWMNSYKSPACVLSKLLGSKRYHTDWVPYTKLYANAALRSTHQGELLANWLGDQVPAATDPAERHPSQTHFTFSRNDTFSDAARWVIQSRLADLGHLRPIHVFGLAESRGEMYTLSHGGEDIMVANAENQLPCREVLRSCRGDSINLGLPRIYRTITHDGGLVTVNFAGLLDAVAAALRNEAPNE